MSACLKLSNTKHQYRKEILKAFHLSQLDFEQRVKELLPFETFLQIKINEYYRNAISIDQAKQKIYTYLIEKLP